MKSFLTTTICLGVLCLAAPAFAQGTSDATGGTDAGTSASGSGMSSGMHHHHHMIRHHRMHETRRGVNGLHGSAAVEELNQQSLQNARGGASGAGVANGAGMSSGSGMSNGSGMTHGTGMSSGSMAPTTGDTKGAATPAAGSDSMGNTTTK